MVFLVLFAFATKNTEPVLLKFFFGISWQLPLVLLVFSFFAVGVLAGMLAMLPPFWRQRRKVKHLQTSPSPIKAPSLQSPAPDLIVRE